MLRPNPIGGQNPGRRFVRIPLLSFLFVLAIFSWGGFSGVFAAETGLYSFEQTCSTGNCPLTAGPASCVAIARTAQGQTVVLTAAHCVEQRANRFFAVGDTGRQYSLALVSADQQADCAALVASGKLAIAPLARQAPQQGQRIELLGLLTRRVQQSKGTAGRNSGRRQSFTGFWSHPGMSGGGYYDETGALVSIHTSRIVDTDQTMGAAHDAIVGLLRQVESRYGRLSYAVENQQAMYCPTCPPSGFVNRIPIGQPVRPVAPPQQTSNQTNVSVEVCSDDIRRMVFEWLDRNPPPAGPPGQPGPSGPSGRDAVVDYEAIIEALKPHCPQGPAGLPGRDGKDGLVGVPDDTDIRNWLVGAMSDAETRKQLSVILADLVKADPRVDALIQRLEALEAQQGQQPADLSTIEDRLKAIEDRKHSQRVLLVDGSTKQVIDDETYTDEPIVLDVRKFLRSGN